MSLTGNAEAKQILRGKITDLEFLKGEDGATFTPNVDAQGNLSWTNNKGLENPQTVNIKGKDGENGIGFYTIDLSDTVKVDFSDTELRSHIVTNVDIDALKAAHKAGLVIRVKVGNASYSGAWFYAILDDYYEGVNIQGNDLCRFGGIVSFDFNHHSVFNLEVGNSSVVFRYTGNPMGNVEAQEDAEQITSVDMTNYETGKIRLTYANDEAMDVSVEFDTNGNPIKFSNGTEEFTITWPEEVATDE